jgi:hypothetical protein
MDWYTSPGLILLASAGSALLSFLVMILLPAFIIRASLGGKRNMPLRKPLRAAIVCVLVGGIAMFLAIMEFGHFEGYWLGWGLIFYAVGVVAATPFVALIFARRLKQALPYVAICLICQALTLILIVSSLFPMLSFSEGLQYFYLACIAALPLTWVHRRVRPETTT